MPTCCQELLTLLRAPQHRVAMDRSFVAVRGSGGSSVGTLRRLNADACPFSRPFPLSFDGCPEFQPTVFLATDMRDRVLGKVRSCQHLGVGGTRVGGFYPRCDVGWPARTEVAAN